MLFEWLYERGYLMSPAENIFFLVLAFGAFIFLCIAGFLLRNHKKWALLVIAVVAVSYISWYIYYPTYREGTHAARYEQLLSYLEETYPNEQFIIEPEVYEPGYQVGEFSVRRADTERAGVTMRVGKGGNVAQTSYWTNDGYPTQETLWQTIATTAPYSLDHQLPHVEKKDSWVDGEWTVFAVTIDGQPALAFYQYEQGGYSSYPIVMAARGEIAQTEWQDRFFVYMDEAYAEEMVTLDWRGERVELNAAEHRGKLVVIQ